MKKGFTLVELSIVLVIIGLLIGGILIAQSMISTAKTQQMIITLEKYGVATRNFKTVYNQVPGDSSLFIPPGNNDNISTVAAGCVGEYAAAESYNAWGHLSQARMLDINYVSYSPTSCLGGIHSDTYTADENAGIIAPFTDGHNEKFTAMRSQSKYPITIEKPANLSLGFQLLLEPKMFMAVVAKTSAGVIIPSSEEGFYVGYPAGQCLLGPPTFGMDACTHPDAADGVLIYLP